MTLSTSPNSAELIVAIRKKCRDLFVAAVATHIRTHGTFIVGFNAGIDVTETFDTSNEIGRYFTISSCTKALHDCYQLNGFLAEELNDAFPDQCKPIVFFTAVYNELGDEALSFNTPYPVSWITLGFKAMHYGVDELAIIHSKVMELWVPIALAASND